MSDVNALREAVREAKELQERVHAAVGGFPPEARALRDRLCAAADRTVLNLELALEALRRETGPVL